MMAVMRKDSFRSVLQKHRVTLVLIKPERFCAVLRKEGHFTQDDEEEVTNRWAHPTNSERAGRFLDLLATKSPSAYETFLARLEEVHGGLFKKITGREARLVVEKRSSADLVELIAGEISQNPRSQETLLLIQDHLCNSESRNDQLEKLLAEHRQLKDMAIRYVDENMRLKEMKAELEQQLNAAWHEIRTLRTPVTTAGTQETHGAQAQASATSDTMDVENLVKENIQLRTKLKELTISSDQGRPISEPNAGSFGVRREGHRPALKAPSKPPPPPPPARLDDFRQRTKPLEKEEEAIALRLRKASTDTAPEDEKPGQYEGSIIRKLYSKSRRGRPVAAVDPESFDDGVHSASSAGSSFSWGSEYSRYSAILNTSDALLSSIRTVDLANDTWCEGQQRRTIESKEVDARKFRDLVRVEGGNLVGIFVREHMRPGQQAGLEDVFK